MKTLTHEQYAALNDGSRLWWLQAIDPDQLFADNWKEPVRRGIKIQFLPVTDLHVYRNQAGYILAIFPEVEPPTYDRLNELWPLNVDVWAFVIRDNIYDDMDETNYFFSNGIDAEDGRRPLPAFNLKDGGTH